MYKFLAVCLCILAIANVGVLGGGWLAAAPAAIIAKPAIIAASPIVKTPPLIIRPAHGQTNPHASIILAPPAQAPAISLGHAAPALIAAPALKLG